MGDVISIGCMTRLKIPVDKVLENAKEEMDDVVLMGWDKDGKLYFSSTFSSGPEILWLLEKCKETLLEDPE